MKHLAVITGGSAGIGRATALELAAAGFDVLAAGRNADELARTSASSPHIRAVVADVATVEGCDALRAAVGERPVAILVHGAGVFPRGLLSTLEASDWEAALQTNVLARLRLVLGLRPNLRGGRVLFIGSDAATAPRPGGAAYSISKAASLMLWQCMVAELGDEIAFGMAKPGLVATSMMQASLAAPWATFPARAVYEAMLGRGETIAPHTVARFFRYLLVELEAGELAGEVWDIRDSRHHAHWLEGALYTGTAA